MGCTSMRTTQSDSHVRTWHVAFRKGRTWHKRLGGESARIRVEPIPATL